MKERPILITGANGYAGARLYSDLIKNHKVVGTYHNNQLFPELIKMDISNYTHTLKTVESINPSVIIHTAALPSPRFCDKNREEARKVNVAGTLYLITAANFINAKIIYLSSSAAANPQDLYGRTKKYSEEFISAETEAGYVILRPSLMLGYSPNAENDRPFNRILKNIKEKTPAVYDSSWKFQPTWLGHISQTIEAVLEKNITGEIIPVSVPEMKSRFDVARDILSQFGIKAEAKDEENKTPAIELPLEKLTELGIPQYNYSEIIEKCVKEIKDNI